MSDPAVTAADVVQAYLADQVGVILARRGELRDGASDSVHKSRVATRRLRSTLRTFRRLFRREVTDPLRDDVRWLARALGGARDVDVMGGRILAAVDGLDEGLVVGDARARMTTTLEVRRAEALASLGEVLDSERYADLIGRLEELAERPPWRGRASKPAGAVLPRKLERAVGRVDRAWEAAGRTDADESLHLLHETRKRAKAVRYGCELLVPVGGKRAGNAVAAWERVTEEFGELQDASVALTWLREIEPRFTGGVVAGLELAERERLRHHLPDPQGRPARVVARLVEKLA
ncbi:MAG: CHAD domain-containing protein [Propionibacterium sp.]|nr:CHAD domain-containing protein [Propionibacterium sp.]